MKRVLKVFAIALAAIAVVLYLPWVVLLPSHDRDWRADHSRLPLVSDGEEAAVIRNIRNWDYAPDGSVAREAWLNATLVPEELEQAYFVVEPFTGSEAIAHTMLSFRFRDGKTYVASVEARREEGESYNAPLAAVLPVFEYFFVWTTERDMFGNSEFWAGDQLYLYPLSIPIEQQRAVLEAMLRESEELVTEPRWYNTLFSNCTNVLARAVNRTKRGSVPFDKSWVLTGYADDFLYEQGMLADMGGFEATQERAFISPLVRELYGIKDPAEFSVALRERMRGGI
ncbi:DUF4105 domain-containing protein [Sagittula sp.]|uniref:lipoprotein N-acyltransferase Lnb domain-containing protein n=1 Tax=Sagittula sp. TaxID=2038081 RepID=UPI003513F546